MNRKHIDAKDHFKTIKALGKALNIINEVSFKYSDKDIHFKQVVDVKKLLTDIKQATHNYLTIIK